MKRNVFHIVCSLLHGCVCLCRAECVCPVNRHTPSTQPSSWPKGTYMLDEQNHSRIRLSTDPHSALNTVMWETCRQTCSNPGPRFQQPDLGFLMAGLRQQVPVLDLEPGASSGFWTTGRGPTWLHLVWQSWKARAA